MHARVVDHHPRTTFHTVSIGSSVYRARLVPKNARDHA
jgi:hypothetical protein